MQPALAHPRLPLESVTESQALPVPSPLPGLWHSAPLPDPVLRSALRADSTHRAGPGIVLWLLPLASPYHPPVSLVPMCASHAGLFLFFFFFFFFFLKMGCQLYFFLRFYLFIFREGKRRRKGEKHQCVVASCTSLVGSLTYNPDMWPDWGIEPATLWFTAHVQPTELHQSGPFSCSWSTPYLFWLSFSSTWGIPPLLVS